MIKKLLPLIFFIGFLQGLLAQCTTCRDGIHYTDATFTHPQTDKVIKPHDGSGTLGQSYIQQNVCGLAYVAASVMTTTRFTSPSGTGFPTTLTIAGIPATCVTILKAYLYYGATYTEGAAPTTTATVTNPAAANGTYPATTTGTAGSVCWGETGTAGYRADVTPIITGNGNYTIDLGGFANETYEVDGVTLIIIYTSPQTWSGSIVLYDGCMSTGGGTMTFTGTGFTACAATGTADAFGCMGDMQSNASGGINTDTYNGNTVTFPNNFWNFNDIPTTLTAGQTTCTYNGYTNDAGDCWLWCLAGLYWQNTGCVACAAGALTLTTSQVDPTCSTLGSATVTVTGGSSPYTYLWSDGQTTSTATGLSGGTYTVTVKDVACNTATATVTLTVASALTITPSTTPASCFGGANGTASVTVTGGTPGYTYSWAPSGGTASTASGLSAGSYTVTVTDASGCTGTQTITVAQPTAITTTTSSTPSNCAANNGTATVTPSGGTPGYTYSWAPGGQTTPTATGLSGGTYTVTVKDANGCTVTATVTVAGSGAVITATTTPTNVLCNGGSTGSATVTAPAGGTAPYTYVWSNAQTGTSATALSIGTYTVTITDKNGCTGTETVTITQPNPLAVTTSSTNATCNQSNGSASVTGVTGGTAPYSYSWAPVGGAAATANGLSAASYTCTVTDKNGCTITATVVVPNANGPRDSISAFTNVMCFGGNNGSATVGVKNGTAPYTYSWNPTGQTTQTATTLSAGTYTVTVTDATGCTTTASVTITQPSQLRDSIVSSANLKCFGVNTGSATAGVTDGTGPYTYSWNPTGQTTPTATTLSAGTYVVTITDANGCTDNATVTITQPAELSITAAGFPTSCFGSCDGQTVVIPGGGTTPYTYLWTPTGKTSASQTGICAGNDSIYVTDANGCKHDTMVTVNQPTAITLTKASTTAFCNQADGSASVTAAGGTPGYSYLWSNGAVTTNITNVIPGIYCVTVTDANKCTDSICVTVPNTPGETATITGTTNVTCNGGNNGTATGGGIGGTAPYTYSWNPTGQTTQTATGLSAGTYTVTVTDATGCTATAIATITEPALVVATPSAPQTVCIGQTTTMSVSAVGGTPPYTFTWNPGGVGTSETVSPATTTTYTITTADANGCPGAQVMITITVNPPLGVTTLPTKATCPGGSVTFGATGSGGNGGPYSYTWIPAVGLSCTNCPNPTVTAAGTASYTVSVTDNCTTPDAIDSEKVIVDPLPVVSFTADTTNGCYPLCINFKDMTTIANPGKLGTWHWTFGDGGASNSEDTTYCYNTAGIYSVSLTVTSDSGCPSSQAIANMITVYDHPHANFTASPQPATIINPTITFTDQSTDAYGIVKWFWRFGDPLDGTSIIQNPSYTYGDTGTYCPNLTVVNKFGCVDSVTECIVIDPFFTLYIPNAFSPNGDGKNDVFTVKGEYVCGFQMYIYDRWGMQLFYTEDIKKGWNGTVNGGVSIAQEDTYVYLINAVDCISFKKHTYIGKVSIVQ